MGEVCTNEAELKLKTEAMLVKQNEEKGDAYDGRGRKSLSERFKQKFHDTFYGSSSTNKEGSLPIKPQPS